MAKKISGAKTSGGSGGASVPASRSPVGGRLQRPAREDARSTSKHSLARRTGEGRGEGRPSSLLDTRVIYCGDNLEQLAKLPAGPCRTGQCWGLPREIISRATIPHSLRHISRGETKEKRAFEDRHENTKAYIDYMRPRCVQLARVLKKTGSFYYHCDWHASHYVKVMLDQIFGEKPVLCVSEIS
jgi:hypothetical protein